MRVLIQFYRVKLAPPGAIGVTLAVRPVTVSVAMVTLTSPAPDGPQVEHSRSVRRSARPQRRSREIVHICG
ncbi:hypothetical protein [Nocardia flavorosea]|uniref:Uncharacterized protein n=1 Tax=Nocardia flavorosea TaxID=53429 RepID=A0A846Y9T2_9NOCA|nr:hypothetical protein [Nocardia flavorosea]NKY56326.1 hypothetical protein [Nocardia flavorosea]